MAWRKRSKQLPNVPRFMVSIQAGHLQFTAYDGLSERAARAAMDTARNALVLGTGTANVVLYHCGLKKEQDTVTAGSFTTENF